MRSRCSCCSCWWCIWRRNSHGRWSLSTCKCLGSVVLRRRRHGGGHGRRLRLRLRISKRLLTRARRSRLSDTDVSFISKQLHVVITVYRHWRRSMDPVLIVPHSPGPGDRSRPRHRRHVWKARTGAIGRWRVRSTRRTRRWRRKSLIRLSSNWTRCRHRESPFGLRGVRLIRETVHGRSWQ